MINTNLSKIEIEKNKLAIELGAQKFTSIFPKHCAALTILYKTYFSLGNFFLNWSFLYLVMIH